MYYYKYKFIFCCLMYYYVNSLPVMAVSLSKAYDYTSHIHLVLCVEMI